MNISDKIRLYPTPEQEVKFRMFCGTSRFVYNRCLAYKIDMYQEYGESVSIKDLMGYIRDLKYSDEFSWLQEVPEAVQKQAIKDLDKAFKSFFTRGNKGFPKFKKKGRSRESFYQRTDNLRQVDSTHIKITGVTECVRVRSCSLPDRVLNPRVTFDGKYWYLSVSYEVQEHAKVEDGATVGVDLGIKHLAITSEGVFYDNINKSARVKQLTKRLKHLQRQVSRKYEANRDGNRYIKTENIIKLEKKIRLLHRRIKNIRDTYIHTVTNDLVKDKPLSIVIEDLNVSGMLKNKHLAKAISNQEFYKFRQYLTYKCKYWGIDLVVADRFYASSKTCSCCGVKKKFLSLSDRVYKCDVCGTSMDRDINAAINLRNYGLAHI